jgi:hypothetical protein
MPRRTSSRPAASWSRPSRTEMAVPDTGGLVVLVVVGAGAVVVVVVGAGPVVVAVVGAGAVVVGAGPGPGRVHWVAASSTVAVTSSRPTLFVDLPMSSPSSCSLVASKRSPCNGGRT